jgi:hypothetical protein
MTPWRRIEITVHCQQILDLLDDEPDPITDNLVQRIIDRMDTLAGANLSDFE